MVQGFPLLFPFRISDTIARAIVLSVVIRGRELHAAAGALLKRTGPFLANVHGINWVAADKMSAHAPPTACGSRAQRYWALGFSQGAREIHRIQLSLVPCRGWETDLAFVKSVNASIVDAELLSLNARIVSLARVLPSLAGERGLARASQKGDIGFLRQCGCNVWGLTYHRFGFSDIRLQTDALEELYKRINSLL